MIEAGLRVVRRRGSGMVLVLAMVATALCGGGVIGQPEPDEGVSAAPGDGTTPPSDETYYQMLHRNAREGSISERAAAINRLGKIGFASALPAIRRTLDGDVPRLHAVALDAASRVHDPAAFRLLVEQVQSGEPIHSARAAFLLVERFPDRAVKALIDGLGQSAREVRRAAFMALEEHTGFRFGFDPGATKKKRSRALKRWRSWWRRNRRRSSEEWWLEQLRAGRDAVPRSRRIRSIDRLVERRSWTAVPALIELLDDPDEAVRVRATRGLRTLTVREIGYDPLGSVSDQKSLVQRWRTWWNEHGSGGRFSWLVRKASGEEGQTNRLMEELVRAAGPERVPELIELLSEKSGFVRAAAIRALRDVTGLSFGGRPDDTGAKRKTVVDRWRSWWRRRAGEAKTDWMVQVLADGKRNSNRKAAAKHLRTVRTERAVTALIRHGLTDRASSVRHAAHESLTRLTGRTFDLRPDGRKKVRAKRVRRWKRWWKREKSGFFDRGPATTEE